MKTILIICVLLASINLFSLSSILARELVDHHDQTDASGGKIGNPNNPLIKCDPKSTSYNQCIAQTKQKPKCDPRYSHSRCTGTNPSGNPNNPGSPTVKPGTGGSGNPKNPAVKPGTGTGGANKPINDPKSVCHPGSPTYTSCIAKQNPKGKFKCVPRAGGAYTRCPPQDP